MKTLSTEDLQVMTLRDLRALAARIEALIAAKRRQK